MSLEEEAKRASRLLKGKVLARVSRPRPSEICLEFSDGTRFFVDVVEESLELSITGCSEPDEEG